MSDKKYNLFSFVRKDNLDENDYPNGKAVLVPVEADTCGHLHGKAPVFRTNVNADRRH